jgi:hypothetical protein
MPRKDIPPHFTDIAGRKIEVGDQIVYAAKAGWGAKLVRATVLSQDHHESTYDHTPGLHVTREIGVQTSKNVRTTTKYEADKFLILQKGAAQ